MNHRPAIRSVAETGSTNADLLAALRAGGRVGEGEWLIADRQVAGRGRQGREWFDGTGNFMGSTAIRIAPSDPPTATLAFVAALALYEASAPLLAEPTALSLKWPNDLLLQGRKLAGILLEREGDAIVAGFGVNLRRAPDLADRLTIALAELVPPPTRDHFAQLLANSFATEIERWRTYGAGPILRRWQAVAHPQGTPLTVSPPGEEPVSGAYQGLDEAGALRLRLEDGTVRAIHAGDVMLSDGGG